MVVECASDSLIPKFLRVTVGTFCTNRFVHARFGASFEHIFRSFEVFLSARLLGWCLKHSSESLRHVSFLPKQLVDLLVKTMVKDRIPLCARDIRKRCEELACPAEDDGLVDEPVDERVDEPVDEGGDEQVEFQEGKQPEQDLHAADIMLRRVHANLGLPSIGLMLRLFRDANVPPEMITVASGGTVVLHR